MMAVLLAKRLNGLGSPFGIGEQKETRMFALIGQEFWFLALKWERIAVNFAVHSG